MRYILAHAPRTLDAVGSAPYSTTSGRTYLGGTASELEGRTKVIVTAIKHAPQDVVGAIGALARIS